MPNEFSNFSLPDTGSASGGYQAPPDPNNMGSNGYVWDPGTKSWVKAGSTQTAGNAGAPSGPNGLLPIRAYDPMAERDRYRGMANPLHTSGPAIDRTVSDQSRGLSMDALSLLQKRAAGGMTPAQALARQQTQGAVNGITSGAASIKGGAGARAAAARGAVATGARVGAQGAQDQAALKAREMADASSQYFGATSAQRDRDIGVATDQAKLDAQQRIANEQRSENYEGLAYGTQTEAVNHARGASAEQAASSNASRNAGLAEDAAAFGKMKDVGGAVTGGVSGAASAYGQTRQSEKSGNPWDPSNYSGSDPKMKRGISPIGEHHKGNGYDRDHAKEYDGKYLGSPFPSEPDVISGEHRPATRQASLEDLAGDRDGADPYATAPPEAPRGESLFGGRMGETAPKGYAAMRAGHEGSMFGASPKADYAEHLWGGDAGAHRRAPQFAPGSQDFYAGKEGRAARDRDVAMSDPKAKQDAYEMGVADGASREVKRAVDANKPEAKKRPEPKADKGPKYFHGEGALDAIVNNRFTEPGALAEALGATENRSVFGTAAEHFRGPKGPQQPGAPVAHEAAPSGDFDTQVRARFGAPPQAAPAPQPQAGPDYFGALGKGAKTSMLSDPQTKTGVHDDPMADANRSMAPSSYEYKPEFTPPEQEPGEVNVGPMADKMEANPVAKTAIVKDPQTGLLAIDKTKGLKLVMGGLADLQRQVDRMQGAQR